MGKVSSSPPILLTRQSVLVRLLVTVKYFQNKLLLLDCLRIYLTDDKNS
jgi:hypothetical protein